MERVAGARGAGLAEKNTVRRIQILKLAQNILQRKIITMQTVVAKKKVSKKKTIVLGAIQAIVASGGEVMTNQSECPA